MPTETKRSQISSRKIGLSLIRTKVQVPVKTTTSEGTDECYGITLAEGILLTDGILLGD